MGVAVDMTDCPTFDGRRKPGLPFVVALGKTVAKPVRGSTVLLLGLAYKRGTSDWRESPSVRVAERLAASGAEVRFCDPYIPEVNALHLADSLVSFSPEELAAANCFFLGESSSFVTGQNLYVDGGSSTGHAPI